MTGGDGAYRFTDPRFGDPVWPKPVTPVTPMVARFKRDRWSATRCAVDAMLPGATLELPMAEYFNAQVSARRLPDAYGDGRRWVVRKGDGVIHVERIS